MKKKMYVMFLLSSLGSPLSLKQRKNENSSLVKSQLFINFTHALKYSYQFVFFRVFPKLRKELFLFLLNKSEDRGVAEKN